MAIFLSYPGIRGATHDASHSDWLPVQHLRWVAAHRGERPQDADATAPSGNADEPTLILARPLDGATPEMFYESRHPTATEVTVHVCQTDPHGSARVHLEYVLRNARINGYTMARSELNDASLCEQIALSCDDVAVTYTPYDGHGNALRPVAVGFHVLTNRPHY